MYAEKDISVITTQIWLLLGGISALLFVFFLLFRFFPQKLVAAVRDRKDRIDLALKARQTNAQIVGGLAIVLGLYFTYQTVKTTQETLQTAQEGQITERFTKAIDQLGRDNLSVRLGGIYALERIARDSARDHWPVMEVLTAHVRERVPVQERPSDQTVKDRKEQDSAKTQGCEIKDMLTAFGLHGKLPADVQAVLDVLSRRTGSYGNRESYRVQVM
jgi:hypothetical protein